MAERTNGVRKQTYVRVFDRTEVESKRFSYFLRPPIPVDGRYGIVFETSLVLPEDEEIYILPEILATFRVDQRHFGTLAGGSGEPHPLSKIDRMYGAFEVKPLSVEEFEALDGAMDHAPHRSIDLMDCEDPEKGLLPPDRFVRSLPDYR